MIAFYRILLVIVVLTLYSCSKVKKQDVLGTWEVREVTPCNDKNVLDDKDLNFRFTPDSLRIIHGEDTRSFYYMIIDDNIILDETTQYGKIVDVGSSSMTIDLNRSEFSFVFERTGE